MFDARLEHYRALLEHLGLLPLADRRILDLGCGNGNWLDVCCRRWGAQEELCFGADLRADLFPLWRQQHPASRITLVSRPAHELDFPDASFDVLHQSMMLSSVPHAGLRERIAATMWRLLRPGGTLISYDFWINPVNPKTVGVTGRSLRRLFPEARWEWARTITVAPPLCRLLNRLSASIAVFLEPLRILNTHYLVAMTKRE